MIFWICLWLFLALPVVGQSPSPSASPSAPPGGEFMPGHSPSAAPDVQPGGEYVRPTLDARAEENPAYFSYMIRSTNSEPWRVPGSDQLIWDQVKGLLVVNSLLILALWRRTRQS